jgi:hypothetical protein
MSAVAPELDQAERVAQPREERRESNWLAAGLPVNANPLVLSSSYLVCQGGSTLLGLVVYNSDASTTYVQVFDASSLPAEGDVPYMVWALPTLSTLSLSWMPQGRRFDRGCWIVNSSTDTTKTLGGAYLLIDAQYV